MKKSNIIYSKYKQKRNVKEIIDRRMGVFIVLLTLIFSIVFFRLYYIQIIKKDYYVKKADALAEVIIEGDSAPRGRIYDRNHNLIVDNKAVKTIYYKKPNKVSDKEEVELAYLLGSMIEVDFKLLHKTNLKEFWLVNNPDLGKEKITDKEWQLLKERKLTDNDIKRLKIERITDEELSIYEDVDKEAAYIYYLMNKGYYYDEKIIKNENVSDYEYAIVSENLNKLKGMGTKLDWDRVYLYGDTFKTILGKVSNESQGLPLELKNYYLSRGYKLNDRVGISYLEYQYEDILKGVKPKYKLLPDNNYELISEGKRGNDIVLTIDIKLQQEIEKILEEEVMNTKSESNTEYYNRSFVVIMNPKTGEILAMAGKQVLNVNGSLKVYDYTPGIITSPVTAGSIVKGASIMVGYDTGVIEIGSVLKDECIKIKATPTKCSWKTMGNINDLTALAQSSNVYQFKIGIMVGKGKYSYNKPLSIDPKAFDIYRTMYQQFGLGVKTGIDLPGESIGYRGSSTQSGHLLDFTIGQYDTYTPIQIAQYISTIANKGYRMKPYLLKEVYSSVAGDFSELVFQNNPKILNKLNVEDKYIERVRQGLKGVMSALGHGYMGNAPSPSGKTGTSQSFIDTDNDGVVDTETNTKNFVGYAPSDDPIMSIVVISPDVSSKINGSYISGVNKRIGARVSNKFFEIYK
jgi:cell division protein FtsI/penicillin-binding protein 2